LGPSGAPLGAEPASSRGAADGSRVASRRVLRAAAPLAVRATGLRSATGLRPSAARLGTTAGVGTAAAGVGSAAAVAAVRAVRPCLREAVATARVLAPEAARLDARPRPGPRGDPDLA